MTAPDPPNPHAPSETRWAVEIRDPGQPPRYVRDVAGRVCTWSSEGDAEKEAYHREPPYCTMCPPERRAVVVAVHDAQEKRA